MARFKREFSDEQIAEAKRLYLETQTPVKAIATMLGVDSNTFYNRVHLWRWPLRSEAGTNAAPFGRHRRYSRARAEPVQPTPETAAMLREIASGALGSGGLGSGALDNAAPAAEPAVIAPAAPVADAARPVSWAGKPCAGLAACPERTVLIAQLWASVQSQIARIDAAHGQYVARGGRANASEAEGYAKLIASLARSLRELANLDAALQEKAEAEKSAQGAALSGDRDAFRAELARRLAAFEKQVHAAAEHDTPSEA
ncbi:MAG: transposase [Beijerinckiaceae bacterium]